MKRLIILSLILTAFTVTGMARVKKLLILHTNDTHSCVMPLKTTLADTLQAGRGGFLRRLAMLDQERRKNPDLLLFDSGDFSQGSSYYSMFKGDVEVGLMNMMRYDAATIGNHEFDFGMENMARLFRMADFPIVCANYDFTGTCVEGLVKPYVVIRRNGVKIGVFGLSPKMKGLVSDKNCVGVKYLDPVKAAQKTADLLKNKEKCDLVVCISHLGWNIGGDDDVLMMKNTRNIDIVLGGHSHSYFKQEKWVKNLDGVSVPNDQNGKSGIFVGRLEVEMKKK
ncbi:bifunctional UDP-sugar hydrolase/5'-nucleotidase [uncultured Prevotella sp.]|uniref:bifunctional metallophosphatase/5'-nucleotidase n=1 Tax=uncultured Prevotella sp. TaxID=159272 RepID=UPI00263A2FEC|nr:bifunctional UDP-sugar hydrolase/5'-nucleotidase [uncultured Prevotella sp.]